MFTVCSTVEMLPEKNCPKASRAELQDACFLRGVEGIVTWIVFPPAMLCECQHEGTWHLPTQQGHFLGPDTSFWQSHDSEKQSILPYCDKIPL